MAILRHITPVGGSGGGRLANETPVVGSVWNDIQEVWRISSDTAIRGGDSGDHSTLQTSTVVGAAGAWEITAAIRCNDLAGDTPDIGLYGYMPSFSLADYYRIDVWDGNAELVRREGGSGTVVDASTYTWVINTDYVLKLRFTPSGSDLLVQAFVGSTLLCEYLDTSPLTNDYAALWGWGTYPSPDGSGWFVNGDVIIQDVASGPDTTKFRPYLFAA